MSLRRILATVLLAATVVVGGAGVAVADDTTPPTPAPRTCEADYATLLNTVDTYWRPYVDILSALATQRQVLLDDTHAQLTTANALNARLQVTNLRLRDKIRELRARLHGPN